MRRLVLIAVAVAALACAATAQARTLSMGQAERAARAAVAPALVDSVTCERQPGVTGRAAVSRAFCTVTHPSADPDQACRSFVLVHATKAAVRADVIEAGVCLPVIETIEV
jgi:hypothetical protein